MANVRHSQANLIKDPTVRILAKPVRADIKLELTKQNTKLAAETRALRSAEQSQMNKSGIKVDKNGTANKHVAATPEHEAKWKKDHNVSSGKLKVVKPVGQVGIKGLKVLGLAADVETVRNAWDHAHNNHTHETYYFEDENGEYYYETRSTVIPGYNATDKVYVGGSKKGEREPAPTSFFANMHVLWKSLFDRPTYDPTIPPMYREIY